MQKLYIKSVVLRYLFTVNTFHAVFLHKVLR